jgi:hypothetical protein
MALFAASERFWAAADAWTAATVAAQASGAPSRSLSAKALRWRLRHQQYLRGQQGLAKRAWIYPGPEAARDAARLIDGIADEVIAVMDPILAEATFAVWKSWPVDTGLSKSLVTLVWTAEGATLTGSIVSGAPYTTLIQSAKAGSTRLPGTVRPTATMTRAARAAAAKALSALSAAKVGAR